MRVRSKLLSCITLVIFRKGFVCVNTLIITGSDAEGASEMFKIYCIAFDETPRTEVERNKL
jgi:asparaginyl-tRNA synthetase